MTKLSFLVIVRILYQTIYKLLYARMKKIIHLFLGFVFVALLAIFAVALFGQAIHGDPYAIALGITEIVLVILPMAIDERKLSSLVSCLWTFALFAWFICTIVWIGYEISNI